MSQAAAAALLQQGRAGEARALLQARPQADAEQDFLLGVCAHLLGELALAEGHFQAALRQSPNHARAAAALATLYASQARLQPAEAVLRKALAQAEEAQLRFNLGVVLEQQQRLPEALACYDSLLSYAPGHYDGRHNRAGLYARGMELERAATDYRELIRRHPAATLPWQNLADIAISQGRYTEALGLLAEVRRRQPDNAKALQSQAIAHAAAGDFAASSAAFRQLKTLDPAAWEGLRRALDAPHEHNDELDPRLIYLIRQHEHLEVCQWQDWERLLPVWRDVIRRPGPGSLLPLSYRALMVALDAGEQRQLAEAIARQQAAALPPRVNPPAARSVAATPARLRVGYLSAAFAQHATGVLLRHFFAAHSADVEVVLLRVQPSDGSAVARDIEAGAAQVLDVSALDDASAVAAIRAQALDIVVDCDGYTSGCRPRLLAARLAPVQLHWLVMPATTGAPALDYYLSDGRVRPGPGWCSEAEVLLDDSYFLFSPPAATPPVPPSRQTLGLPATGFVFCCLNAPQKIDPETFGLWMDLLRTVPDSVLWLLGNQPATALNLRREAEWRGVAGTRLLFAPRLPQPAHMARMGAADLFLDTRYCNAHTTAAEALWAGLPLLSCAGASFAARVGSSLLHSCGLPELVAQDWADYRRLALRAAQEPGWLAGLRARLAQNRLQAGIFDGRRQAAQLERAYWHMHKRAQAGLPPAPFALADLPA